MIKKSPSLRETGPPFFDERLNVHTGRAGSRLVLGFGVTFLILWQKKRGGDEMMVLYSLFKFTFQVQPKY